MAQPKVSIVILKGNLDVEGARMKVEQLSCVLRFVQKAVKGVEILEDNACFLVNMPAHEGDALWTYENVMRRVYIDNAHTPEQFDEKAERLLQIYKEQGGTDQAGVGIIRYYLNMFYMLEKSASIFVR